LSPCGHAGASIESWESLGTKPLAGCLEWVA